MQTDTKDLVAGRPYVYLDNVSRPTITVYSPKGKNTGAAIVVFPGGGYQILAIDLEGTEVCDWLTSEGITCVLHHGVLAAPSTGIEARNCWIAGFLMTAAKAGSVETERIFL